MITNASFRTKKLPGELLFRISYFTSFLKPLLNSPSHVAQQFAFAITCVFWVQTSDLMIFNREENTDENYCL